MDTLETPGHLAEAGRELWDATVGERDDGSQLELRADELVLLAELCRYADDVERLRDALADAPLTVTGSQGQQVANPLRSELHRTVTAMDRLQRTLALPDDPEDAEGRSSSHAGRNLARLRWGA